MAAEAIPDAAVVAVLRPFVRAAGPVLDGVRESDPFGLAGRLGEQRADDTERGLGQRIADLAAGVRMPGTAAWQSMGPRQRTTWWVDRLGRFTTLVAAVPGLGGALADRLPVGEAVGAASQGLLLCAIAGEYGITDTGQRVRLLGWVLLRREIAAELAAGSHADAREEDRRTAELTQDLGDRKRTPLRSAATAVVKLGRALWSVTGELEKRPRGRWYHRGLGKLPVVGMLADYRGERTASQRAAQQAVRWIHRQEGAAHVDQA